MNKKIIIIAAISVVIVIGTVIIFLDVFSNQVPAQNTPETSTKINLPLISTGKRITIDLNESMSVAAH